MARNIAYAASSVVFSLRAPTQPTNAIMKVMAPPHMKINAGSRAMFVNLDRLLNVSFSVQAQIPIARTPSPRSQKMTLNPKMTYLRQQETSLVSRILLRLLCPGWFGSLEGIL